MVGKVHDGWLIGGGGIFHLQLVVVGECVEHLHFECSGKSCRAVFVGECQRQCLVVHLVAVPHAVVISHISSVQAVPVVVLRQLVFLAVECEPSVGNAVAVSSDECSEVAVYVHIVGQRVVSEHHVAHLSVAVGHEYCHDASAVVGHLYLHAVLVAQGEQANLLSLQGVFKIFALHAELFGSRLLLAAGTHHEGGQHYGCE